MNSMKQSNEKGALNIRPFYWLIGATSAITILFTAYFLFFPKNNPNIVATVLGENIERADFNLLKDKYAKAANFMEDEEAKKSTNETTLNKMIEWKALEVEAKNRGISITDQEIETRYKEIASGYGSEDELIESMKATYDFTPELAKRSIKASLFREKLEPLLLNKRDVFGVFVRYDLGGIGATEAQLNDIEEKSKAKIVTSFFDLFKENATRGNIEQALEKVQQEQDWVDPIVGSFDLKNLNQTNAKEKFSSEEDWEAIKKLNTKGQNTEVIRSKGGYFVIYRLEDISNGKFSSWEEFTEDAKKSSKIYSLGYKKDIIKKQFIARITGVLQTANSFKPVGLERASAISFPQDCDNKLANGRSAHFSEFQGRLIDPINDLYIKNVSLTANHGNIGTFPACSPQEKASHNTASSSKGWFELGDVHNKNNLKALSCWVRWNVSIKKTGYESISYGERAIDGNGVITNMDAKLGSTETYSGAYKAQNTNNNAIIWMKPINHAPKAFHFKGPGSINSGGSNTNPEIYDKDGKVTLIAGVTDSDFTNNPERDEQVKSAIYVEKWDSTKKSWIKAGSINGYAVMQDNKRSWSNLHKPGYEFKADINIQKGKVYRWKVKAQDNHYATSNFTGWWYFKTNEAGVVIEPPPIDPPGDNSNLKCVRLTATPSSGLVPLTVNFTAEIQKINTSDPIKYEWDFDGNGSIDQTTETNQASNIYTVSSVDPITAKLRVFDNSTPLNECKRGVSVSVNPWSSGEQGEVAP